MYIRQSVTGDIHELFVSGRIDGLGANMLEEELLKLVRLEVQTVYVNLADSTFLCSAGLRVLVQYYRQMKSKGKTLLVTRPSPDVGAILETSGFGQIIVEKV
jgi:anti-anti-sigma factor